MSLAICVIPLVNITIRQDSFPLTMSFFKFIPLALVFLNNLKNGKAFTLEKYLSYTCYNNQKVKK